MDTRSTRWPGSRRWPGTCAATSTRSTTGRRVAHRVARERRRVALPGLPVRPAPADRRRRHRAAGGAVDSRPRRARADRTGSWRRCGAVAPGRRRGCPTLLGPHGSGHRLELLGGRRRSRRPAGCRCSPTTRTSARPCRRSGTRWVCTADRHAGLPVRRRRLHVLRRARRRHRAQRSDIAWGFTNLGPDVSDLYLEKVDGDRLRVRRPAARRSDVRTETIEVAGARSRDITVRDRGTARCTPDPTALAT